ncbi:MAG TPA: hypothetical protein VJ978_07485, partial [Nitriliruptoraceae bacterium]|nr:hypothetical protein [Nitriliruptoraceae bacterium]
MTSTTSNRSAGMLRGRLGAAALVAGLVAAGVAAPAAPARAAATGQDLPGNCDLVVHEGATFVECVVTDSGTVTFDDLVGQDLAPHVGAPVAMTARGGAGADLPGDSWNGRRGGEGGLARTVATADDIDRLHVYVGSDAAEWSFEGGSSTVVSAVPIEDVTDIDDTWLVAGGGGAQGAAMCAYNEGAGSGGRGGTADATRAAGDATSAGWNGGPGSDLDCSYRSKGHPGTGGDRGVAGTNAGDPRSNGIDGVGGHGGDNGWQGNVAPDHLPGRGGVTSVYAMGGGGWGGGGGGERNGGGGGGGSFA